MKSLRFKVQSSKCKSKAPRGVSVLEVVFAILVTSIGLMGAIAIFPVAMAQTRRGLLNDASSVAGISAVHQFDTQYMRSPNEWLYYDTSASQWKIVGTPSPGAAYYLDPAFMANASSQSPTLGGQNDYRYAFPYYSTSASTSVSTTPAPPRMTRISLKAYPRQNSTNPMTLYQADAVLGIHDDLAYNRPGANTSTNTAKDTATANDRSLQASQLFTPGGSKRETEGYMSWAATIAPKLNATSGDLYVLSVLVFNRRDRSYPLDTALYIDGNSTLGPIVNPERLVDVNSFPGGGIGGGEVLLQARPGRGAGDLDLRANDWLMLSGRTSAVGPVFLWYRVVDVDADISSGNQRYVTLQGPDWPLPNASGNPSVTQATIASGVVAVYEKTIRVDNSN